MSRTPICDKLSADGKAHYMALDLARALEAHCEAMYEAVVTPFDASKIGDAYGRYAVWKRKQLGSV